MVPYDHRQAGNQTLCTHGGTQPVHPMVACINISNTDKAIAPQKHWNTSHKQACQHAQNLALRHLTSQHKQHQKRLQPKKFKACTPTLPILLAFVLGTGRLTRGGRQSLKHGLGAIKPCKHSVSAAQRQTCLHLFLAEPPARAPSLLLVAHKP